jgi:amidohydrolase
VTLLDTTGTERAGELHQRITDAVAELAPRLLEVSRQLHAHPELALAEHRSAALLADVLDEEGFTVERGVGGVPTAFRGDVGDPAGGPTVALLCEYDALPGIGHGCGHNLIAAGGLGAALALHRALPELSGRLTCLGTPGEEGAGGKVLLLDAGVFDDVDAALMFHPSDRTLAVRHATACQPLVVEFTGRAAHAAASAPEGRSALAAMIQFFVGTDALRQFVPETCRLHGIISHGGEAANVVPAYTRAEFMVRGLLGEVVDDVTARVEAVAAAAAAATGTSVTVTRGPRYAERKNNKVMAGRLAGHLGRGGVPVEEVTMRGGTGSSDIGNVSLRLPTIHPYLQVMDAGTPTHSEAMAEAVRTPRAEQAMLRMATALACTAADLFTEPGLLDRAREEFATTGPDVPR